MQNKPVNYKTTRQSLDMFFGSFGQDPKLAEDPSRPGLTPDDMTEGKKQTDETDKGTGNTGEQGALGKEMANEVKNVAPAGASVENAPSNGGDSTAVGITAPPSVTESPSPADDSSKMDNVDPRVKEAAAEYATFYRLSNAVVDLIDGYFDQNAAKNASDLAAKEAADRQAIQQRAVEMKQAHIAFLCDRTGCTPKEANDLLNKLADENPAAILPPEALSDEEINATLADAAAQDAAGAGVPPEGETPVEGGAPVDGGMPGEGEVDPQMVEELQGVIDELQQEGFSEEEIQDAIEQTLAEGDGGAEPPAEPPAEEPKVAADPTLAPAAEADPAGAAPEEPAAEAPGAEGAPAGADEAAVQEELEQIVQQLIAEGYSQEEITDAIMQEMGITPDDVVDIVVQKLMEEGGLTQEQAMGLLQDLGQLEQEGVTPEQFAEALPNQDAPAAE